MTTYEEKTGGDVLAIAHNGNLSNGIMFPLNAQYDGKQLDKQYVAERAKWEATPWQHAKSSSPARLPGQYTPRL